MVRALGNSYAYKPPCYRAEAKEYAAPMSPHIEPQGEPRDAAIYSWACPCDHCALRAGCATAETACARFVSFVQGAGQPRWSLAPRVPSRALFLAAFDVNPTRGRPGGGSRPGDGAAIFPAPQPSD